MPQRPTLAADLLQRLLPLALIVALAALHGLILSRLYDFVSYFVSAFSRRTMFYHPLVLEYLPSALIALFTLLLAGIPAAVYERLRTGRQTTPASLVIWLIATLLITAPVFTRALGWR
jgi:hypothetical protein